jgi:hypothetical protein
MRNVGFNEKKKKMKKKGERREKAKIGSCL